jgi:hypothetical protein
MIFSTSSKKCITPRKINKLEQEQKAIQKNITLVNETNDDDYNTLEKPFQLQIVFDHLKNLSAV